MSKKFCVIIITFFLFTNELYAIDYTNQKNVFLEQSLQPYQTDLEKLEYILSLDSSQNQFDASALQQKKEELFENNLHPFIVKKYFPLLEKDASNYKKSFLALQYYDMEAWISPYYLLKLKSSLRVAKYDENNLFFKAYVYIFYRITQNYKANKSFFITKTKKNLLWEHSLSLADKEVLKKFWFSLYSQQDLDRLKNYIDKNKISPDAKLTQLFFVWKNTLSRQNGSISLKNTFENKLQKYPLSCEINSASLFASYISKKTISENKLWTQIPFFSESLKKEWEYWYWGNPNTHFVWKVRWQQTKYLDKMTWYWVYADPVVEALNSLWIPSLKKEVSQDTIIQALENDSPVVFWYITPSKSWFLNTQPVIWYTLEGEEIQWYIWEHTGVITKIDYNTAWKIENVYFYEWKKLEIQKMSYDEFLYKTSFFNMMITKK